MFFFFGKPTRRKVKHTHYWHFLFFGTLSLRFDIFFFRFVDFFLFVLKLLHFKFGFLSNGIWFIWCSHTIHLSLEQHLPFFSLSDVVYRCIFYSSVLFTFCHSQKPKQNLNISFGFQWASFLYCSNKIIVMSLFRLTFDIFGAKSFLL